MTTKLKTVKTQIKSRFRPNMKNYTTSLKYEGLNVNDQLDNLTSIDSLKSKYAR